MFHDNMKTQMHVPNINATNSSSLEDCPRNDGFWASLKQLWVNKNKATASFLQIQMSIELQNNNGCN